MVNICLKFSASFRGTKITGSRVRYLICCSLFFHALIQEEYGLSSEHSVIILKLSETIMRKEANPTLMNILTGKDLKKTLPTRYNYQEP
jgi:hypothetical protein